ncbi:hypothetical protein ACT4US_03055 [Bacillus sp. HC-Mk]
MPKIRHVIAGFSARGGMTLLAVSTQEVIEAILVKKVSLKVNG